MHKVIVNSTPLIALSHVGRLDLLMQIYETIIIPKSVFHEVSAKKGSVCEIAVINFLNWIMISDRVKEIYNTSIPLAHV